MQMVMVAVAVCFFALLGAEQAAAAAWGGMVSVVPTALFAWATDRERREGQFLAYGLARTLATLALMAVALAWARPAPFGFFAALGWVQLAYVVVPSGRSLVRQRRSRSR
ncbi:MAG: ATP synthase subunit I [Gammaproteobacteria bacterium]|nr:ATP synthase subunit I [Gammaproteobacteria bacterium]